MDMVAEKLKSPPDTAERLYRTHFPYGIKKMKNGKYFMFNREYQPLGCLKDEIGSIYNDNDIPEEITFHFDFTSEDIRNLSIDRSSDTELIFLYDDRNNPSGSKENMTKYLQKLTLLMSLKGW